jgi:iron-sulfur cluster repair protein YtfE (RIC family)
MSIRTTKPFLDAHAALRDQVEHLLVAAQEMPELDLDDRIELVERIAAFLADMLLPHVAAEERILYPQAARLLGGPDESDTAARDHAAVRELLGRMVSCDADQAGELQEIIYALYVRLSAHVWREEAVYLRLVKTAPALEVNSVLRLVTQRGGPRRGRFVARSRSAADARPA